MIPGKGAAVWSCMVLEMDIGIICGCLSGIKPVLSRIFPNLFGGSHKTRSGATRPTHGAYTSRTTHSESFAFSPLSDASNTKLQKNKLGHTFSVETLRSADNKDQHNFAWASSGGKMDAGSNIPPNAIGMTQVLSVAEKELGSITPRSGIVNKLSDAGSEEWIMDDALRPRK